MGTSLKRKNLLSQRANSSLLWAVTYIMENHVLQHYMTSLEYNYFYYARDRLKYISCKTGHEFIKVRKTTRSGIYTIKYHTYERQVVTSHVVVQTSQFIFHSSQFSLHSSHFIIHSSYFTVLISYFTLHTLYLTFHTSHFTFHTLQFIVRASYFTLHTSQFIVRISYFTLPTSQFILHCSLPSS